MMRFLLPTALAVALLAGSAEAEIFDAQEEIGAQEIAAGCHALVAEQDLSEIVRMGECLGAVSASAEALSKLHGYYRARFPNLTYPLQGEALIKAYADTTLLLGTDVCLPRLVSVRTLAGVVDRYAQSNPQKVIGSGFQFVSDAIVGTYGCGPHNPNPP
jgi:hypothetical protein